MSVALLFYVNYPDFPPSEIVNFTFIVVSHSEGNPSKIVILHSKGHPPHGHPALRGISPSLSSCTPRDIPPHCHPALRGTSPLIVIPRPPRDLVFCCSYLPPMLAQYFFNNKYKVPRRPRDDSRGITFFDICNEFNRQLNDHSPPSLSSRTAKELVFPRGFVTSRSTARARRKYKVKIRVGGGGCDGVRGG